MTLPVGGSGPPMVPSAPNGISMSSAITAQLTLMPNTQTDTYIKTQTQTTLYAISGAIDRIYAPRAGGTA